jgi:hypothetical protein
MQRKAAEREGKIDLSLVGLSAPRCRTSRQNPLSRHHISHCAFSFMIRRFFLRLHFYRASSVLQIAPIAV